MNKNSGLLCPYLESEKDFRCSMGINKMEGYVCGGYGSCPYEEDKEGLCCPRCGSCEEQEIEGGSGYCHTCERYYDIKIVKEANKQ